MYYTKLKDQIMGSVRSKHMFRLVEQHGGWGSREPVWEQVWNQREQVWYRVRDVSNQVIEQLRDYK